MLFNQGLNIKFLSYHMDLTSTLWFKNIPCVRLNTIETSAGIV